MYHLRKRAEFIRCKKKRPKCELKPTQYGSQSYPKASSKKAPL